LSCSFQDLVVEGEGSMDDTSRVTRATTPPAQDEQQHTHVFVLRVWKVPRDGRLVYRGNVRDAASGAQRNFANWSVAERFVIEQVDEYEGGKSVQTDGS
jgi:hypothetical protein